LLTHAAGSKLTAGIVVTDLKRARGDRRSAAIRARAGQNKRAAADLGERSHARPGIPDESGEGGSAPAADGQIGAVDLANSTVPETRETGERAGGRVERDRAGGVDCAEVLIDGGVKEGGRSECDRQVAAAIAGEVDDTAIDDQRSAAALRLGAGEVQRAGAKFDNSRARGVWTRLPMLRPSIACVTAEVGMAGAAQSNPAIVCTAGVTPLPLTYRDGRSGVARCWQ